MGGYENAKALEEVFDEKVAILAPTVNAVMAINDAGDWKVMKAALEDDNIYTGLELDMTDYSAPSRFRKELRGK